LARLAFLGSPPVAARTLRALVEAGHDLRLVVTAADKRRGRGAAMLPTPVKQAAAELGIPVSTRVGNVVTAGAELGVVVAFGRLISPEVLRELPMVNLHFSLLPRWRGAAPVERAILSGDAVTGVCLMQVEEGLDTGAVYGCTSTPIGPEETAAELRDRLGTLGTALLLSRLEHGVAGLGVPTPQSGEPTYAAKLTADDLRLDFSLPAVQLQRVVRVGRAWCMAQGRRLIVHRAAVGEDAPRAVGRAGELPAPGTLCEGRIACGEGWLVLLEVQAEGRRRQPFAEWARGARLREGDTLS
jgi:methionyl-tRNA formyltransferase